VEAHWQPYPISPLCRLVQAPFVDQSEPLTLGSRLRLKYFNSISDAIKDLGVPEEISKVFVGFQKYLYQPVAGGGASAW